VPPAVFLILLLLLALSPSHAQRPASARLPEPRLVDTPWGDFPVERLRPGARLRLTSAAGRTELRLAALVDSTLDLRSTAGDSLPPLTFAELRALRRVEVYAEPAWRERAGNIGFVVGAVIGALAGAVAHTRRDRAAGDRRPGLWDDIGASTSLGFGVGYVTGRMVIGRARWRPVTLP
jgi:hypothetical protein